MIKNFISLYKIIGINLACFLSFVLFSSFENKNDLTYLNIQSFNANENIRHIKMRKLALNSFVKISNIGSASGLVYYKGDLYIICDNSGFLTKYNIANKETNRFEITKRAKLNIAKKKKPDFESISLENNKLKIYGSGSTAKRESQVTFDILTEKFEVSSLTTDYNRFKSLADLSDNEFNIEGVFFDKNYQYYCQRGNKSENKNCIFRFEKANEEITVFYYKLPLIDNVQSTFTDAITIKNTVYFLASAEDSNSTYKDGEVKGTLFGIINKETMKLTYTGLISDTNKFEGITFFKEVNKKIHFLICKDDDVEEEESEIFELIYSK